MSSIPENGEISREEFLLNMKSWAEALRQCRINVMDETGEPLVDIMKAEITEFNAATGDVQITCGETKTVLHLGWADRFRYFDYDDSDEQMQKYFEEGYSAWLRAYSGDKLLASLLLA